MPDENVKAGVKNVCYSTDGLNWTPLGKAESFDIVPDCDVPTPKVDDWSGSLRMETVYVSRKDYKFLRRLLGLMRLSHVWAYRRERKGHPRCR
jgi:hypothetical protein